MACDGTELWVGEKSGGCMRPTALAATRGYLKTEHAEVGPLVCKRQGGMCGC